MELTETEKALVNHIEFLVDRMKSRIIVSSYIYNLVLEKMGKDWVSKNIQENLMIPLKGEDL